MSEPKTEQVNTRFSKSEIQMIEDIRLAMSGDLMIDFGQSDVIRQAIRFLHKEAVGESDD